MLALVWYRKGPQVGTNLVLLTSKPQIGDYVCVPIGEHMDKVPVLQVSPMPDHPTVDYILQVSPPQVLTLADHQGLTGGAGR